VKETILLLRPANEDEREALGALKLRATLAWGDHPREVLLALRGADELAAELLAASFVAEIDGRIVGFATLVTKDDLEAEVEELFIEPSEWRKGIGTRLWRKRNGGPLSPGRAASGSLPTLGLRPSTTLADSV